MPGGRPTKLTPQLQARIVKLLETGNYVETAAGACGVHKDTLYEWLKRGEEEASGPYRQFSDAVKVAFSNAESSLLERIHKSSKDAWQAAAWLLERTRREKYAVKSDVTAKLEHSGGVTVSLDRLTTEDLLQIVREGKADGPVSGDDEG